MTPERLVQLRAMADPHICYEVEHLVLPLMHHRPLSDDPAMNLWVERMVVESALVHLRNVVTFLTEEPKFKTDVNACDYFDDQWATTFRLTDHDDTMKHLHRRLAHISTHRLDDFEWSAVIAQIPNVAAAFAGFLDDLAEAHEDRAGWFARLGPWQTAT